MSPDTPRHPGRNPGHNQGRNQGHKPVAPTKSGSPSRSPSRSRSRSRPAAPGTDPLRARKMARLSTLVDDMIEPSVRKRGFVLSRLVSNWHDIAGEIASWCKPVELKLDKNTHKDGVLKLSIASGRGPQAQQMTPHIIDRVNAAFGYAAISRVTLVQTMASPPSDSSHTALSDDQTQTDHGEDPHAVKNDIWTLDEKLAGIKSPELRAALRRFGTPIDEKDKS